MLVKRSLPISSPLGLDSVKRSPPISSPLGLDSVCGFMAPLAVGLDANELRDVCDAILIGVLHIRRISTSKQHSVQPPLMLYHWCPQTHGQCNGVKVPPLHGSLASAAPRVPTCVISPVLGIRASAWVYLMPRPETLKARVQTPALGL